MLREASIRRSPRMARPGGNVFMDRDTFTQQIPHSGTRIVLTSARSFDEVCAMLETLVGRADLGALTGRVSEREIRESVAKMVGPSGFVIFQVLEHGLLLSILG